MSLAFTLAAAPEAPAAQAGRRLFAGEAAFLKGVVEMTRLPAADRVEVCFAGRSNVGKSTLINALTGRRALARTSSTPGRTQEINFFAIGSSHYLVDLPGYGFARAPARSVARWQSLMRDYLSGRPNLRRVFLLIDARRGVRPADEAIMELLDRSAVNFQAVLTKADKIGADDREMLLAGLCAALSRHPAAFPEFLLTSAVTGAGIATLRTTIAGLE